jgi:hypothetical protein
MFSESAGDSLLLNVYNMILSFNFVVKANPERTTQTFRGKVADWAHKTTDIPGQDTSQDVQEGPETTWGR